MGCVPADLEIKQGIRWIMRCSSSSSSRDSLVSHAMSCGFSGSHNFARSQEVRRWRLESLAGHIRTDEPKSGETQLCMRQISVCLQCC